MRNVIVVTIAALVVGFVFAGPAAAQNFCAIIDGLQQNPPVATPGSGIGKFTKNADNTLSFNITFGGLLGAEIAAHIHGPAPVGVNAGVIFPLPLGSPKIGVIGPLTPTQCSQLLGGLMYINIHSNLFPGGEIRGQITLDCSIPVENETWGAIKALYESE